MNYQHLYYMTGQKPIIILAFANEQTDNTRYLRQLNQELRKIQHALREAKQENLCQIEILAGATFEDILQAFRDYKNQIAVFHYGGHADGFQLLLESEKGNEIAHGEGFANILAELPALELVFLNGCSTQEYAQKITQNYPISVIATENAVDDEVARTFAVQFYRHLAQGETYFKAYQRAENILKTKKGSSNFRALYRKQHEPKAEFPWKFWYKDEFYFIKNWTLITKNMNNQIFSKEIRKLLAQKPETAIQQIIDFLEDGDKDDDLVHEITMQQTAWNDLAKEIRQNTVTFENANIRKAQIIRSITEILKAIKNLDTAELNENSNFDLKTFKETLKDYINKGELSDLFEKIEENNDFVKYDASQFYSLKNRVIDGETSTNFKQQLKVFIGTLKVR